MSQNSFSVFNWQDIVEQKSPKQVSMVKQTPILYASNLKLAKEFYKKFFANFSKFKMKNKEDCMILLSLYYRGCYFTLNKKGQIEFDARCPNLASISSPFIFYVYAKNNLKVFNQALKNGFEILPTTGSPKNLDLMLFLVLCKK